MIWINDSELFALMRTELYTAVVGDILDTMSREHQFLLPAIRPLHDAMVVAGRAMPVLMMDVFGPQTEPFGKMTHALDDLRPNEVYVGSGSTRRCANWGEIMTTAAIARRAAGAVVYGYHRDTRQVLQQGFPVFSLGAWAQDSAPRMKVVDYRVPVEIDGVTVRPGDIVFGDVDGVVVVPHEIETEVLTRAREKSRAEKRVRADIEEGLSATDALERYGIL